MKRIKAIGLWAPNDQMVFNHTITQEDQQGTLEALMQGTLAQMPPGAYARCKDFLFSIRLKLLDDCNTCSVRYEIVPKVPVTTTTTGSVQEINLWLFGSC